MKISEIRFREGKIEWIEKINRTTEKPIKNPS